MRDGGAILPLIIALLVSGCTGPFADGTAQGGTAHGKGGSFLIPQSRVSFTALYSVSEGSAEISKKVWRSGNRMRIDMGVPGSAGAFSLYFTGAKAYSCTRNRETLCFDITGSLTQNEVEGFFPDMNLENAVKTESVEIGNGVGDCYFVPYERLSSRKLCFTDQGVLAYEEYVAPDGTRHVEYLTDLVYAVNESDFVLPAEARKN